MKDIKTIIQILPEIYSITKDIENSLNSDSSYSNSDDIKLKISMIYQNLEQLFGEFKSIKWDKHWKYFKLEKFDFNIHF